MGMYYVMSFKPIFARKIVSGGKDCEVRTYFGLIKPGDRVLIYASSPLKAFLGVFNVVDVSTGTYSDIVKYINEQCTKFDEDNWRFIEERYLRHSRRLIALKISDVRMFQRQVSLYDVKVYIREFKPPRSYSVASVELISTLSTLLGFNL